MWESANRREAGILFGEQADDGLAGLLGEHVEIAVLKTGKDGSITATGGELIRTPGNDVEVVDTTGAGDMFAAGFLAGLALGQGARKASVLAGELAERVITKTGAQFGFDEISAIRSELLAAPKASAD